ncbi:MAG TPA: PQQ-binding-like beta-propeller repeat protein [Candidatus Dormibacteraeota bacterium]|nr:PQQ-binding-like beta-propeller repeat protein [Candidatus Dormibacteraeota bacterium]
MTINDRDALVRLAISVPETAVAPADLADSIAVAIRATKQNRGLLRLGRLGWLPRPNRSFVALALLLLAALVAFAIALSRPRLPAHLLSEYHGGPDRTGIMVGPGPAGVPKIAWDVSRPGALPFTTMPLVQDGRVYVADASGAIAALDAATGTNLWPSRSVGAPVRGTPALADGLFIVGTDAGDVVALSTMDGAQAWDKSLGGAPISASLLLADGRIFAASEDGTLAALDAVSGAIAWKISLGAPVLHGAALSGGVLYVGATGGRFFAIDADTGHQRWNPVELGPGGVGTPAVANGAIYVGSGLLTNTGAIHVLSVGDGTAQWSWETPDQRLVHPGAVTDRILYVVSDDGNVYAVDLATHVPRWTGMTHGALGTLASLVGNALYVSSADRTVYAFDATSGANLWGVPVIGVPTMGAVVDGSVFVGTALGHVYAIRDPAGESTPAGS